MFLYSISAEEGAGRELEEDGSAGRPAIQQQTHSMDTHTHTHKTSVDTQWHSFS